MKGAGLLAVTSLAAAAAVTLSGSQVTYASSTSEAAFTSTVTASDGTEIIVDPTSDLGPISPLVYGANHRYAYDGFGMWDPKTDDAYPAFVSQVRQAGISAVRYPGGTIANTFHWQRAIGPQSQRTPNIHGSTGEPLDNTFGPDEYGRFLQETGATGDIVVNFATGTAREAADWVEYMTTPLGQNPNGGIAWAEVRAANGHPAPYDIPYWEVGNELANASQRYWMAGASTNSVGQLYALGGSTTFTRQPVGSATDWRAPAALSDGSPGQVFYAHYPPLAPGSQIVYVGGTAWQEVADLSTAGSEDVYQVDAATGRITFGDGTHGNIPPDGAQVTMSYTSGPHDGFSDFYQAMKAVNPSISICSAIGNDDFLQTMGADHPYDCVVQHPYVGAGAINANQPIDDYHAHFMLQPETLATSVSRLQQSIARYAGPRSQGVSVVLTEYGHLASSNPSGYDYYHRSLDEALFDANAMREWITLGIPLAERHALTDYVFAPAPGGSTAVGAPDNAIIAGPGPATVPEPQADVFSVFTHMMGDRQVASEVNANPQTTLSDGTSLPHLTTLASTDADGHVYLVVVNQSAHDDVTARVRPLGYKHRGSAETWTVNGPSYLSYNTPEHPNTVTLLKRMVDLGAPGDFTYQFPAHSVTAFRLTRTSPCGDPSCR